MGLMDPVAATSQLQWARFNPELRLREYVWSFACGFLPVFSNQNHFTEVLTCAQDSKDEFWIHPDRAQAVTKYKCAKNMFSFHERRKIPGREEQHHCTMI